MGAYRGSAFSCGYVVETSWRISSWCVTLNTFFPSCILTSRFHLESHCRSCLTADAMASIKDGDFYPLPTASSLSFSHTLTHSHTLSHTLTLTHTHSPKQHIQPTSFLKNVPVEMHLRLPQRVWRYDLWELRTSSLVGAVEERSMEVVKGRYVDQ